MQSLINLVYPLQCPGCDAYVSSDSGVCGTCWRDLCFVGGNFCDKCGVPMIGDAAGLCDECIVVARPWKNGRTTLLYEGLGRRLVLSLKHGDRIDLVPTLSSWMSQSAQKFVPRDSIVVPVPLHRTRLFSRRYNQAGLLAKNIAKNLHIECQQEALIRTKKTSPMKGLTRDERFAALSEAIRPHLSIGEAIKDRTVVIVDDVMTSGGTLAACTEACYAAGAGNVHILTLARVSKAP